MSRTEYLPTAAQAMATVPRKRLLRLVESAILFADTKSNIAKVRPTILTHGDRRKITAHIRSRKVIDLAR